MNNESASSLPLVVSFLCITVTLLILRTLFPDAVQSGVLQYVGFLPIVVVVSKLRLKGIRCSQLVLGAGVIGVGIIASIPLVRHLRARLAPPPLVLTRFDGDLLGSATARFSEQLSHQLRRYQLPRGSWVMMLQQNASSLDWPGRPLGEVTGEVGEVRPLLIVGGTERRLRVTMPPARSVSMPSLAHPSLAPFLPPLKLWGGGVSFGVSVDQFGATAEFLTLLIDGMRTRGESGELSLIDAARLGGLWTSGVHRAVPLLLVSERLIARAVAGERVQEGYLKCASRRLSRAISLGDFSRDRELQAALYTDYGVVLWLRWTFFHDKAARKRAIVLWRAVSSSSELSEAAKESAIENEERAIRPSTPKKKRGHQEKKD